MHQYGHGGAPPPKESLQLFVGNVVGDAGKVDLRDFLNLAMKQVGLCAKHEEPIVSCRQSAKFAFLEFSSVALCNAGLSLNGIPFLGALLKIDRPAKYAGPRPPTKTWQEMTGQAAPSGQAALALTSTDPTTKGFRELFVGNTPPDTTAAALSEFLGGALQRMGMALPEDAVASGPAAPIADVRVSAKFCFVELRSVEEATNALNLNGIPFAGQALNIKRSSKHDASLGPPPSTHHTWDSLLAAWMSGELKKTTSGVPTRVLCVTNMVAQADLESQEQYVFVYMHACVSLSLS
eukprot:GSChrysophyteH2.ASY1.ANO1.275.1 assembled CDS